METLHPAKYSDLIKLFKSYYVVWKRWSELDEKSTKKWFKSYYVVWKRLAPTTQKSSLSRFKSYYVVWKLITNYFFLKKKVSLNRTM